MLDLKYSLVVDVSPLYTASGKIPEISDSPFVKFVDNLAFYINDRMVGCESFNNSLIKFDNEKDLMIFFLSFDENDFHKSYSSLDAQRKKQALDRVLKQAKELNW